MAIDEIINLAAAVLVAGPVACFLTQLIKRSSWSKGPKFWLAVVLSFLVGLGQAWLAGTFLGLGNKWGHLTANDVAAVAGCVFAGASAFYKLYFGGTSLGDRLARL